MESKVRSEIREAKVLATKLNKVQERQTKLNEKLDSIGAPREIVTSYLSNTLSSFFKSSTSIDTFFGQIQPTVLRIKRLHESLSALSCTLRSDSKLCESYILHNDGDPSQIAIIMREMKFFYEMTTYEARLRTRLDSLYQARDFERDYYYRDRDFPEDRTIDHESASETAKDSALRDFVSDGKDIEGDDVPESIKRKLRLIFFNDSFDKGFKTKVAELFGSSSLEEQMKKTLRSHMKSTLVANQKDFKVSHLDEPFNILFQARDVIQDVATDLNLSEKESRKVKNEVLTSWAVGKRLESPRDVAKRQLERVVVLKKAKSLIDEFGYGQGDIEAIAAATNVDEMQKMIRLRFVEWWIRKKLVKIPDFVTSISLTIIVYDSKIRIRLDPVYANKTHCRSIAESSLRLLTVAASRQKNKNTCPCCPGRIFSSQGLLDHNRAKHGGLSFSTTNPRYTHCQLESNTP